MNTLNILKQIIALEFGTMSLFACLGALLIMLDLEKLSKFCFIVSLVFLFIMVLTAIGYMWWRLLLMVSYKVAVLFLILTIINSSILLNYYGEENLSNMTKRVLIVLEDLNPILFGIFLLGLLATICQLFGWV